MVSSIKTKRKPVLLMVPKFGGPDCNSTFPLKRVRGMSCFMVAMVTLAGLQRTVSKLPAQHSCDHWAEQAGVIQGGMKKTPMLEKGEGFFKKKYLCKEQVSKQMLCKLCY